MTFYLYTLLDDPSATAGTYATGVNDSGEIVGHYLQGNTTSGFVYNGGTFSTVTLAPQEGDTQFQSIGAIDGINNSGQISGSGGYSIWTSPVGGSGGPNQPTPAQELLYEASDGFLATTSGGSSWTPIQAEIVRGAISNEVNTSGYGINSAGDIVGYFYQSGHNPQGFIWSPSSPATIINYPGATSTEAFGINDQNQVVGTWVGQDANRPGVTTNHGFLYTNGSLSYFDDPSGANGTFAEGINNSDEIVGYYLDANGKSHGFIFNESNGTYLTLDMPGATNTYIYGVNNTGELVGAEVDSSGNTHGFEAAALPTDGGNNDIWVLSGGQWEASAQPGSHPVGYNVAAIGDWTGGGTDGILWYNSTTGDTDEWKMSNAAWAGSVDLGTHPGGYQISGTGDFFNNGIDDVLWTGVNGNGTIATDIWELGSSGKWAASVSPGAHPAGYNVAGIGDWRGNGTDGILWYNATTGDTDEWQLNSGQWSASIDLGTNPSNYQISGIGDFFDNGRDDVLWTSVNSNGTVSTDIWELGSNGQWIASVSAGSHPAGYQVAGVGDFTGAGTSDILWYNASTGDADEWLINNGKWAGSVDLGVHAGNFQIAGIGDFTGSGTSGILWHSPS